MEIDNALTLITKLSSVAIALSAILAFLAAFVKPIRRLLNWLIQRVTGRRNKTDEVIREIRELKSDVSAVKSDVDSVKMELANKIDEVSGRCKILSTKIDGVEEQSGNYDALIDEKIANVVEEIRIVKDEVHSVEKSDTRNTVLDFANSCKNGRRHTKEEFEHIFDLNERYKELLDITNDSNGVFAANYEYIVELYKENLRNNSFL